MAALDKKIPSIGSTRKEIYRRWEELDREINSPSYLLVGYIPTVGIFQWLRGDIVRLLGLNYVIASQDELESIDEAILKGWFQVEARPRREEYKLIIYHQATGRELKEKEY